MYAIFGVLFVALGLILLGYTALSVARGIIWRSSNRYKTQPRWHPPRPVYPVSNQGLHSAWAGVVATPSTGWSEP